MAEASQESQELPAGESSREKPSEQPVGLGSVVELSEPTEPSQQETVSESCLEVLPSETVEVSEQIIKGPFLDNSSELKQMLAGIMAAVQQSNEGLNSVRADLSANQESVKADINSVRADLSANNENIQKFQERVTADISSVRNDIKVENEKLIKRFELQNQEAKKEFAAKLDSEARRLTSFVGQVRKETESELLAVKRQIQAVSTEFETRIGQANANTQGIIEELSSQVVDHRSEVEATITKLDQDMSSRFSRQKESIEQVNAKIVALESKICEVPTRSAVVAEPCAVENLQSPSVVNQSDLIMNNGTINNSVPTNENPTCSCQSSSCNVGVSESVNAARVHVSTEPTSVSSFLSTSELPLPLFDDCSDINPVFHLRRLDEFIRFKGVPKALQLAVAYRSIVGQMSKQWVETVSRNLTDYEAFKRAFLNTWWSASRQSLVKCSLYQGKYSRNSNLSLSGYFLKYATLASYLEPRPTDVEVIEAIRYHFPIGVQRAMLANQLHTIEATLDLLKRVEVMEASEGFQKPHNQPQNPNPNASRPSPQTTTNDRRFQTQNQVRQIQYSHSRNRNHWNRRRNNYPTERAGESNQVGSSQLNPNARSFQGHQEQVQPAHPNNSRSEN
jgi:hypothetical protein